MQSYWFGDVEEECCTPVPWNIDAISARVLSIRTRMDRFVPLRRTQAIACGIASSDAEYRDRLHELAMHLAREAIARQYQRREVGLLQMTRTLDELDNSINLLTERAVEWYGTKNLSFTRKYKKIPAKRVLLKMKKDSTGALGDLVRDLEGLGTVRASISREISDLALDVLPNCSALVGGLVAARLLSNAGSLQALARMPASSLQVLGAKTALFSHIRTGTPPPKHGVLFQHRRVHNAPKEVRGRVARTLSAKLGIAAKIDYFRQVPDHEFLAEANLAIDRAGDVN